VERANGLIFEAIKKSSKAKRKENGWRSCCRQYGVNTTVCRAINFTSFQLMYGVEVVLPKEVKHRRLRTATVIPACPSEAKEKHLLELDRHKAVENLQKYQEETRAWREPMVKFWDFDLGNLVLLRSPLTESTDQFEAKWTGPYVITEKTRPRAYHLLNPQG
jgi:hypothetical protein